MHIIDLVEEPITLRHIEEGFLVRFTYLDTEFYLRPPTTGELDDANTTMRLARVKFLNRDDVQELANWPTSLDEQAAFERLIEETEKKFEDAEDGTVLKERAQYELANIQTQAETRTALDEQASEVAVLARDRDLLYKMLCDADGKTILDIHDPKSRKVWDQLSLKVKDRARAYIWQILGALDTLPFESVDTLELNSG